MERFDKFQSSNGVTAPEPAPTANGITKSVNGNDAASSAAASPPVTGSKRKASSESDLSDIKDDSPVPKKVKKSKAPTSGEVESDEKMAARLQAELNAQTSSRATRGGNTKRKTPAKKATKSKKKSAAKIGAEDDSDLEGGSGVEKPEKEKKGGFHVRSLATTWGLHVTMLIEHAETNASLRAARCYARRKSTLSATDRQADMGLREGARPAGAHRQAADQLR